MKERGSERREGGKERDRGVKMGISSLLGVQNLAPKLHGGNCAG